MDLNIIYVGGAANNAAPSGFYTAFNYVVNLYDSLFTNNVTVNIDVSWGSIFDPSTDTFKPVTKGLGQSISTGYGAVGYASTRNVLLNENAPGSNTLPLISPEPSGYSLNVNSAEAKALGFLSATDTALDGSVGFNSTAPLDFTPNTTPAADLYYFVGSIEHEISEVMGRTSALKHSNEYQIIDLYRYSAPDVLQTGTGAPSYFSINSGVTDLDNFNNSQTGNTGDLADWARSAAPDAYLDNSASGVINDVTNTDIILMGALGWTFDGAAATPLMIQGANLGVLRVADTIADAVAVAANIDGTQTFFSYVNQLIGAARSTTVPAVAVEGSMYGAVGSSAVITNLVTNFLPGQIAYANLVGLDPVVFACLETALVFAFGNETGATTFANNYGPSNTAMPATHVGDAAFASAAATAIFGSAQTANTANALLGYVDFLEGFFTANGIVGVTNPTSDQIVIAARAGAWGEGVAIALENNLGSLPGQVTNFLEDAAQGTAVYSASLASQPTAAPFQGAASVSAAMAGSVQVTGVAAPIDHVLM
jgi:hypothetical protein